MNEAGVIFQLQVRAAELQKLPESALVDSGILKNRVNSANNVTCMGSEDVSWALRRFITVILNE